MRHAPLPADVQLAFVHNDELSLNPFLSEQAAAALLARKPKLPGKLAERMARQPGLLTAASAFAARPRCRNDRASAASRLRARRRVRSRR